MNFLFADFTRTENLRFFCQRLVCWGNYLIDQNKTSILNMDYLQTPATAILLSYTTLVFLSITVQCKQLFSHIMKIPNKFLYSLVDLYNTQQHNELAKLLTFFGSTGFLFTSTVSGTCFGELGLFSGLASDKYTH